MPAELSYGPGAVKQFMGVDRDFGTKPVPPPAIVPKITEWTKTLKPVTEESSTAIDPQARRLIELGDAQFAKQKCLACGEAVTFDTDSAALVKHFQAAKSGIVVNLDFSVCWVSISSSRPINTIIH